MGDDPNNPGKLINQLKRYGYAIQKGDAVEQNTPEEYKVQHAESGFIFKINRLKERRIHNENKD